MNVQGIRERIGAKFNNVQEVANKVFRSVRRQGDSALAVYLFDLNDRVTESAAHLESYLDDVLGSSYFDENAPADLRWNHYLYLVADKNSASGDAFEAAKRSRPIRATRGSSWSLRMSLTTLLHGLTQSLKCMT